MAAPPSQIPPPYPDEDRAGPLIAIYWVEAVVAIAIVALRIYARSLTRSIGPDDWMMVITLFFQLVLAGFVTKYALIGGTKHLAYLRPDQMKEILMWNYILQCWGINAFTPAKISVGLLINRLMKPFRGWRFWVLTISLVLLAITNTLDSIFTYVQCNPARALWDKSITDAKCWHPSVQANISIAQASYNIFVDAVLATIPATLLWSLTLSMKKKVGLSILLGLGFFAAAAGSIKASKLARLTARSDLTWEMYDLILWSGTENFVVLFCGSIPPLKPLWDRARAKGGILASLHISRGGTQHTEDYSLIERNGVGMKGGVGVGVSTMEGSKGSLVSRA